VDASTNTVIGDLDTRPGIARGAEKRRWAIGIGWFSLGLVCIAVGVMQLLELAASSRSGVKASLLILVGFGAYSVAAAMLVLLRAKSARLVLAAAALALLVYAVAYLMMGPPVSAGRVAAVGALIVALLTLRNLRIKTASAPGG
jgi:hypothetical protein